MAIVYSSKINSVRVKAEGDLADVVKEVDISYTGTDGDCSFTLPCTIKLPSPEAETFTAFADLTEEQIVSWVEAQDDMLEPRRQHIAIVLEREVEKAASTNKPLPWEPAPVPPAPMPLANPEE